MPNTQPGAASTTPKRRQRTAPLPPYSSEAHLSLVWVYSALASAIDAEILWRMHEKRISQSTRVALINGSSKLKDSADACIVRARDSGQLLLCWHGTRSLEVPA